LPILAGGAYLLAQKFVPGLGDLPSLFLSQVAMIGLFGITWLVVRQERGHDPKLDLARSPILRQLVIGSIVVLVALATARGVFLLASFVVPTVPALAETDQAMEELVLETRTWSPLVAVLVIAVLPAFSEEIWCRAFLGRGLVGQYGVVCGVLITSYFFGAIHVLPHQGAMAMLLGLALHYSYITTRSILAPMLLHFLNNATSVLGSRLGEVAESIDTEPDRIPFALYACAIFLLAGVAWALYQSRARILRADGEPYLPDGRFVFPGVALPPPNSGATITHPWPSLAAIALVLASFGAFAAVFTLGTMGYRMP
jgi:membrane protease YdiL (CAAX protease family)